MSFPLVGAPAWYGNIYIGGTRNGITYQGEDVLLVLVEANHDATDFAVIDRHGDTVKTGSLGSISSLGGGFYLADDPIAAPVGGWPLGWLRISITGPHTDATWGTNMGSANFMVFREDDNFAVGRDGVTTRYGGQFNDPAFNGILGIGSTRLSISNTADPAAGTGDFDDNLANMIRLAEYTATYKPVDTVRGWPVWCAFENTTWDYTYVPNASSQAWLAFYVKDASVDGGSVYVKCDESSTPGGNKITIRYPDASTVVETYDNLVSAEAGKTAINAASNYVRAFRDLAVADPGTGSTTTATAIGQACRDGIIQVVETLYPLGVTHYEGPKNEPPIGTYPDSYAHLLGLLASAVHIGHPSAKAMGPCSERMSDLESGSIAWRPFLQACADQGVKPDAVSTHTYNTILNGDLASGRYQIERWLALLAEFGWDDLPTWDTEANSVPSAYYGTYHPNFSQAVMTHLLLWEQYGMPKEQNPYWYGWSHGFWAVPNWAIAQNGGTHPYGAYYRVLSEEVHGKTHHHRIDFGSEPANRLFLGSVYAHPTQVAATVAVLLAGSYMPDVTVTLDVTGTAADLVCVDAVGNESTLTNTAGQVEVPVDEYPTYVRLPAGVTVTVATTSPFGEDPAPSLSMVSTSRKIGGLFNWAFGDNAPIKLYASYPGGNGISYSTGSLPDSAVMTFDDDIEVEGIVVDSGPAWQSMPALLDFDVDLLDTDDVTWVTQETVTVSAPSSFQMSNSSVESGCSRETYWRPQTKFVVMLDTPVTTKGVRVYARSLSYGGEPDAAAQAANGQGMASPQLALVEVMVLSRSSSSVSLDPYDTEVLADSPRGYWPNDPGTGVVPSVVNTPAMDATVNGSPSRAEEGLVPDGSSGTRFTGTSGQNFQVADSATVDTGNVSTFEVWVSPAQINSGAQAIMGKGSTAGNLNWNSSAADGKLTFQKGVGTAIQSPGSAMGASSVYHLVVVKSATRFEIWKNGELVGSRSGADATFTDNATDLYIGDDGPGSNGTFRGVIHKPALYATALSAERIRAHYLAGVGVGGSVPEALIDQRIQGSAYVGSQLAVLPFFSNFPTAYTYQWQRCDVNGASCSNIGGETSNTHLVTETDIAHTLRCVVTASNAAGSSSAATSASVGPVGSAPVHSEPTESNQHLALALAQLGYNPEGIFSDTALVTIEASAEGHRTFVRVLAQMGLAPNAHVTLPASFAVTDATAAQLVADRAFIRALAALGLDPVP